MLSSCDCNVESIPTPRRTTKQRCVVATGMDTEIGAIQGAVTEASEKACSYFNGFKMRDVPGWYA